MQFQIYYPISPIKIIQLFGANAAYYAKFLDDYGQPQKGHMGVDLMAAHGQPVYAAHDGLARYVGPDSHGGDGIYIRTTTPDENGKYWNTIYWHLCAMTDPQFKPLVSLLTPVKKGDLIGYADNTGAPFESSGDHLHFSIAECDVNGNFVNNHNGYGGCQDPLPFFNGEYAHEVPTVFKHNFIQQLDFGATGYEVNALQNALKLDGEFPSAEPTTNYFGSVTLTALQQFQTKHGIASSGTPTTTGFGRVGPKTMAVLNQLYNK